MHSASATIAAHPQTSFHDRLNGTYHELALRAFMVVVLGHWLEHLVQTFQIYVLGWPVPEARGLLGLFYPWMVKSETLHYGYAIVMLIGLWTLRKGFTGKVDRFWWTEHVDNLKTSPAPNSTAHEHFIISQRLWIRTFCGTDSLLGFEWLDAMFVNVRDVPIVPDKEHRIALTPAAASTGTG